MNHSTASAGRMVRPEVAVGFPRLSPPPVPLPQGTRLDLLRGMLIRLEDVTPAGQHYLMEKVLPLLRREALEPNKHVRPCDLEVIARSLDELEHEASRLAPDPGAFGRKAQVLVDVFALA
jgi:hypothetical protein